MLLTVVPLERFLVAAAVCTGECFMWRGTCICSGVVHAGCLCVWSPSVRWEVYWGFSNNTFRISLWCQPAAQLSSLSSGSPWERPADSFVNFNKTACDSTWTRYFDCRLIRTRYSCIHCYVLSPYLRLQECILYPCIVFAKTRHSKLRRYKTIHYFYYLKDLWKYAYSICKHFCT